MYLPKTDIYNALKTLNYYVSQTQPASFNNLPAIVFRLNDNSVNLDLNNTIISQDIEVNIDIWAEDSVTASTVLSQVEETMRQINYKMSYSSDIPNTGNLFHINCRFTTIA
ncbi:MAG: hypothetical protein J6Y29_03800 [Clostridiales bacterium]|nr:hypothetical protein [Clostridiales bacterium]